MKSSSFMSGETLQIITDPQQINEQEWDDFVRNHPQGNIFQTSYICKVFQGTQQYVPVTIFLVDAGAIVAVLVAVIQFFMNGIAKRFSARAVIWGGPLIKDNNQRFLEKVLDAYDRFVNDKALFTEVRALHDTTDHKEIYQGNKYRYEDHLNILVDLTKSEDELWQEIHSKRRNEIRRAVKEQVKFSDLTSHQSLADGYHILEEVYHRANLPLPEYSFFDSALKNRRNGEGLKIFSARYDNKMIGTMFTLCFKNCIYDWYAGSYSDFYRKYPNDLIPWEVFKWGKQNGFTLFDFGGAGKPGVAYGVRDYKKKFGGQLVNYGRYQKIYQPFKMKIAEAGFRAWKLINNTQISKMKQVISK